MVKSFIVGDMVYNTDYNYKGEIKGVDANDLPYMYDVAVIEMNSLTNHNNGEIRIGDRYEVASWSIIPYENSHYAKLEAQLLRNVQLEKLILDMFTYITTLSSHTFNEYSKFRKQIYELNVMRPAVYQDVILDEIFEEETYEQTS